MKTYFFTTLILLLSFISLNAQELEINKYSSIISSENIETHIKILAADSLEGRKSGLLGQKKAAKYISNFFIQNNVEPLFKDEEEPYYQKFDLINREYGWRQISFSKEERYNWDHILFAGNDSSYKDSIRPHYAGYYNTVADVNISEDYKNVILQSTDLKTAISIIDKLRLENNTETFILNFPNNKYFKKLEKEFRGIHGIFFKESSLNKNIGILNFTKEYIENSELETVLYNYTKEHTNIRVFIVDNKLCEKLINTKASKAIKLNRSKINIQTIKAYARHTDTLTPLSTENVVGVIKGKKYPDEYVVIMAHYDHLGKRLNGNVYNGAYDNASGTAAMMEVANAFAHAKKNGLQPDRSIIFIAATAEEIGLMGSKYFLYKSGIDTKKIKAVINMDMIGRYDKKHDSTSNYVYVVPHKKKKLKLKKSIKFAGKSLMELDVDKTPGLYIRLAIKIGSDQYNVIKNDIPAISLGTGLTSDYHTIEDTADKINYKNVKDISKLVFMTSWYLSSDKF
jgi:Peptidase family M28